MTAFFDQVFENLFADPKIRPPRFYNFCSTVYNAMDANNESDKYTSLMSRIKIVMDNLISESSNVDAGLTMQVNHTKEVKQFIKSFRRFMKDYNGAICFALGGANTNAAREFYPHKNKEYLLANGETMMTLTGRVKKLAKKYANPLGSRLSAALQVFRDDYITVLSKQHQQMVGVGTDRLKRNAAYTEGQWVMTEIVHEVANLNRRNPKAAKDLFTFRKLYPPVKTKAAIYTGKLAASESRELLNRFLTRRNAVTILVPSVAADVAVWLAAKPADDMPAIARMIKAGSKIKLKAEELGDLANTSLMIRNVSEVNEAKYKVRIIGFKRAKEVAGSEEQAEEMTDMKYA